VHKWENGVPMDNKIPIPPDPESLIDIEKERRINRYKLGRHTPEFCANLLALVQHPDTKSCSYFGLGDHMVMEIMAAEQERRATLLGVGKFEAFPLSLHIELSMSVRNWGTFTPEYSAGILENLSLFVIDYPVASTTRTFMRISRKSADIVFSSTPQTIGIAPEGNTLSKGYLIYRLNHRPMPNPYHDNVS
jgi:hypothetical protein